MGRHGVEHGGGDRVGAEAGLGVSIIPDSGPFSPIRPDVRILPFGPPQIERWIGFLSKKAPLKDKTIAALIDAANTALG